MTHPGMLPGPSKGSSLHLQDQCAPYVVHTAILPVVAVVIQKDTSPCGEGYACALPASVYKALLFLVLCSRLTLIATFIPLLQATVFLLSDTALPLFSSPNLLDSVTHHLLHPSDPCSNVKEVFPDCTDCPCHLSSVMRQEDG